MTEKLIERINQWNDIKYPNDKETRIELIDLGINAAKKLIHQ